MTEFRDSRLWPHTILDSALGHSNVTLGSKRGLGDPLGAVCTSMRRLKEVSHPQSKSDQNPS